MKLLFLLPLFSLPFLIFGQEPLEPNAAAFTKFFTSPVNKYTGSTQTTIPLYTIELDDFSLPIDIRYHHGGILVSEEASNIGLGWSLNYGGNISRNISGSDDFFNEYMEDTPNTKVNNLSPIGGIIPTSTECKVPNSEKIYNPERDRRDKGDTYPDTFYYDANGNTGKFILNANKNPIHLTKSSEKIVINQYSAKIIDQNGNHFYYTPTMHWYNGDYYSRRKRSNSYRLTKIVTSKKEEINFVYEKKETFIVNPSYEQTIGVSFTVNLTQPSGFREFISKHSINEQYLLKKIIAPNTELEFNYSSKGERKDIYNTYYIKSIKAKNSLSNNIIKKIDFNQSYFGQSIKHPEKFLVDKQTFRIGEPESYGSLTRIIDRGSDFGLRLKLDEVKINNIENYNFEYFNESKKIDKTTFSQDYWGYYNGVVNKKYFIPDVTSSILKNPAKRHAVFNECSTYILNKIKYPTGGNKIFEYELNSFSNVDTSGYIINCGEEERKKGILCDPSTDGQVFSFDGNSGVRNPENIDPISSSGNLFGISNNETSTEFILSGNIGKSVAVKFDINFSAHSIEGNYNQNRALHTSRVWVTNEKNEKILEEYFGDNKRINYQLNTKTYFNDGYSKEIVLPYGKYKLHSNWKGGYRLGYTKIKASWQRTFPISYGGGLRIKSIKEYDSQDKLVLQSNYKYEFKDKNGIIKSTGKLFDLPRYNKNTFSHTTISLGSGGTGSVAVFNDIKKSDASSSSQNILSRIDGALVGYDKVQEIITNKEKSIINEFSYHNISFLEAFNLIGSYYNKIQDSFFNFPRTLFPQNGLLKNQLSYNSKNKIIFDKNYFYRINDQKSNYGLFNSNIFKNTEYVLGWDRMQIPSSIGHFSIWVCGPNNFSFRYHPYYSHLIQKDSETETIYDANGENPVTTTINYKYENKEYPTMVTGTTFTNSKGEVIENTTYYPDDIVDANSLPAGPLSDEQFKAINRLKKDAIEHRIGQPIQTVTKVNGNLTQVQRTLFKTFPNNITLPQLQQSAKADETLQDRLVYHSYTQNGKPKEVSYADGPHTMYVWGYEEQYPIAKIENASYNGISQSAFNAIQAAITASGNDKDAASETMLKQKLEDIRKHVYFKNAQVSTYTYDPLVGVTSMTDPKGYTMTYHYDAQNRLKFVKDADGNVLSENDYNYKK